MERLHAAWYGMHGLAWVPQDTNEDVQSVAAQCLLPLVPVLQQAAGQQPPLQALLWSLLTDADDLSPATGAHAACQTCSLHGCVGFVYMCCVTRNTLDQTHLNTLGAT